MPPAQHAEQTTPPENKLCTRARARVCVCVVGGVKAIHRCTRAAARWHAVELHTRARIAAMEEGGRGVTRGVLLETHGLATMLHAVHNTLAACSSAARVSSAPESLATCRWRRR